MSREGNAGDALPTFIVDRQSRYEQLGHGGQLGDYIEDIDFDTENLRRLCHDFGFTDDAINDLTIHVGCNPAVHHAQTAEYRHPSSTIWVYAWRQSMLHQEAQSPGRYVRIEDENTLSQALAREIFRMAYSKGYYESSQVGALRAWARTRGVLGYLAMSAMTLDGIYVASVGMRAGSSPPTPIMLVGGVLAGVWIGGVGWLHNRRLHDAKRIQRQVIYEIHRVNHRQFSRLVHVEPKVTDR